MTIIKFVPRPETFDPLPDFGPLCVTKNVPFNIIKCIAHLFGIRDKISPICTINPPLFITTPLEVLGGQYLPPKRNTTTIISDLLHILSSSLFFPLCNNSTYYHSISVPHCTHFSVLFSQ